MTDNIFHNGPGLLVSVRNPSEALAALAGGADVIDVKEPDRGSLGAASPSTIAAVVQAVNGRVPVTAAAGELVDVPTSNLSIPDGVSLFKVGLAECRAHSDWQTRWQAAIRALASQSASRPVAVAYADWLAANSPQPGQVLGAAVDLGCPALLVDTWDKSAGSLFDHWPASELATFVRQTQSQGLIVVLAGSLIGESVAAAALIRPDLVAVRTAACNAGRRGTVSSDRVRSLRQAICATAITSTARDPAVGSSSQNAVSLLRNSLGLAGQKFS